MTPPFTNCSEGKDQIICANCTNTLIEMIYHKFDGLVTDRVIIQWNVLGIQVAIFAIAVKLNM